MPRSAVIFGAGKIARGFIAHLLVRSGHLPVFVEAKRELVELLRSRGRYRLRVLGASDKDCMIDRFRVHVATEVATIADELAAADLAFTAVGGPNLAALGPALAAGLRRRLESPAAPPLNVFICENYHEPARVLRDAVEAALAPGAPSLLEKLGLVECQVLRSAIDADPAILAASPLELRVQDAWRLPCDADAIRGALPSLEGLEPIPRFGASLQRKLYTYNAANAAVAYLGYLAGHRLLAEAANDPEILRVARGVCDEAGRAIVGRHGFDPDDQRAFGEAAIAKYRDRRIVDPIERNARDPIRKLSRNDRLVGPATLCIEEGVVPESLATAIVAALRYDEPGDPSALQLQAILRAGGIERALEEVCGLEAGHPLAAMVRARWEAGAPTDRSIGRHGRDRSF